LNHIRLLEDTLQELHQEVKFEKEKGAHQEQEMETLEHQQEFLTRSYHNLEEAYEELHIKYERLFAEKKRVERRERRREREREKIVEIAKRLGMRGSQIDEIILRSEEEDDEESEGEI
jgi:hypothetical protein